MMAGELRRWWVHTLRDCLKSHFKMALLEGEQSVGKEFGIQGKVNWIEKLQYSRPGPWSLAVAWVGVTSLWSTMAQIPS